VLNASVVSFLLGKIQHLPSGLVYGLVILLVFGEAALFIGFVLPGETAVIVAGVVASQGHVNVGLLCLLVVVSAIAGDSVGYAVGHRYGDSLLKLPIVRDRRVSIERALDGLAKRGPVYVFVGRFTAFLRAVMPGLAGMSKMRYRRFLAANALGASCGAWATPCSATSPARPLEDRELRELVRYRRPGARRRPARGAALREEATRSRP